MAPADRDGSEFFFPQQKGTLITARSSLIADLVTVVGSQYLIGCFLLVVWGAGNAAFF